MKLVGVTTAQQYEDCLIDISGTYYYYFFLLQVMVVASRSNETTKLIVKRSPRRQSEFTKYILNSECEILSIQTQINLIKNRKIETLTTPINALASVGHEALNLLWSLYICKLNLYSCVLLVPAGGTSLL